jgi:hypothetical protein
VWPLAAIVANTTAAAYAAGGAAPPASLFSTGARAAAVLGLAGVPLLVVLILLQAPLFAVNLAAVVLIAPCVGVCCCSGIKEKCAVLPGCYTGWVVVEAGGGLIVGYGLQMAASSLLADPSQVIEPEWRWLWHLVVANTLLGVVSAALSCTAGCILYSQPAVVVTALPSSPSSSGGTGGPLSVNQPLLPGPAAPATQPPSPTAAAPDELDHVLAGIASAKHSWKCLVCFPCWLLVSGCLLASGLLWLHGEVDSPGLVHGVNQKPPDCGGCYCGIQFDDAAVHVTSDIRYGEALNTATGKTEQLMLDVYAVPHEGGGADAQRATKAPVAVLIHGGGFVGGTKLNSAMVQEARWFAQHGFVAVSIEYRLSASAFLPELGAVQDAVSDLQTALAYLAGHAADPPFDGIDMTRVFTWGASAGAITSGTVSFPPRDCDPQELFFKAQKIFTIENPYRKYVLGPRGNIPGVPNRERRSASPRRRHAQTQAWQPGRTRPLSRRSQLRWVSRAVSGHSCSKFGERRRRRRRSPLGLTCTAARICASSHSWRTRRSTY